MKIEEPQRMWAHSRLEAERPARTYSTRKHKVILYHNPLERSYSDKYNDSHLHISTYRKHGGCYYRWYIANIICDIYKKYHAEKGNTAKSTIYFILDPEGRCTRNLEYLMAMQQYTKLAYPMLKLIEAKKTMDIILRYIKIICKCEDKNTKVIRPTGKYSLYPESQRKSMSFLISLHPELKEKANVLINSLIIAPSKIVMTNDNFNYLFTTYMNMEKPMKAPKVQTITIGGPRNRNQERAGIGS
jgi:hypothetical protein